TLAVVPVAPAAAATAPAAAPFAIALRLAALIAALDLRLAIAVCGGHVVAGGVFVFERRCELALALAFGHGLVLGGLLARRRFAAGLAAASAPAPPASPPSAVARLGRGFGGRFVGVLAVERGGLLEIVLFLERCGERLRLLGDGARRLERVHQLAAIDDEGHGRRDRLVRTDGEGDGEALFQAAQVGALLVEHVGRHVGPRAGDEIVRGAAHQLLFERAQHLQRQRRDRTDMAGAAAIRTLLGRAFQHARP